MDKHTYIYLPTHQPADPIAKDQVFMNTKHSYSQKK